VDVNDNDPVLEDFEIIFNNYITNKSSSFPTGAIGKVPARDPDVSDKLLFTFVEGNELNLLILNQDTGELKLSKDLDNNRPLEATMRVTVSGETHYTAHSTLFGHNFCFEKLKLCGDHAKILCAVVLSDFQNMLCELPCHSRCSK